MVKVEAAQYGDRKVYSVSAFQPPSRRLALATAERLGRGRGHRASAPAALGQRLLHAQGSGGRLLPASVDAAQPVRRAAARPRRRRASTRLRAAGALRAAWRLSLPGPVDRAFRARRPPGGAGTPEAQACGRGLFEQRRPLPRFPSPNRNRDRQRRGREAGRPDGADNSLPACAGRGCRDVRPGPAGCRRSSTRSGPLRDRRRRRDRPRARRRRFRGPPAVQ